MIVGEIDGLQHVPFNAALQSDKYRVSQKRVLCMTTSMAGNPLVHVPGEAPFTPLLLLSWIAYQHAEFYVF